MVLHHVQKLVKQWGVSASCVEIMTPPQDLTRLNLAIHNAPFSKKMFHLQASPAYFSHVPTLPSVDDVWLSGGWRYCDVPFYLWTGRFCSKCSMLPLLLFFCCIWCQYLNHLSWQQGIITPCGSQRQEGDSSTFTAPSEENVDDCLFKQASRINCGHEWLILDSQASAGLTVVVILCKCIEIDLWVRAQGFRAVSPCLFTAQW